MNKLDRRIATLHLICAGLALWLALIACNLPNTTAVGDLTTATQSVDLGSADSARVEIEFPAGELSVDSGTDGLMEAVFRFNVADWQPQVEYAVEGSQGKLVIQTSGEDLPVGDEVINQWDIHLSDSPPLDVFIETGAGMSDLNLSQLDLSALRVKVGAGETNVDLRGSWDHDVTAVINGGVGQLSIQLPAELGVRVNIDTGIVNVTATGLNKDSQGYVNQALGTAPYTLTLEINAGVGSIALSAP